MIDWQLIVVVAVVGIATVLLLRRIWNALKTFRANSAACHGCAKGCETEPNSDFVQINLGSDSRNNKA